MKYKLFSVTEQKAASKSKPRPQNRREFMNKLVIPTDPTVGNPNDVPSEEVKPGQPEFNRAYEISQKNDTDVNVNVGIKDIDEAVLYYFENKIKPTIVQNNIKRTVPVLYGSPERWKSVQADGYYRDTAGKIQAPLIMFKRETIEKDRSLSNKLDGNKVHNVIVAQRRFSRGNAYDNFAALNNRMPKKEYVVSTVPDYITVTYNCIIFTDFVEQMDKLVEMINFASDSYWGDPSKWQFRVRIDSFSTQTLLEQGQDRAVKSSFTMVLHGYVIPDSLNKELATINRSISNSQIVFGLETAQSSEQFTASQKKGVKKGIATIAASDSVNVAINQTTSNVAPATLVYINTSEQLRGATSNYITAVFPAGWLTAPTGLPATSVDNFTFFCNGQLIERTAIISFTQFNGVSTLVVNNSLLGYIFQESDEITGIGKWNLTVITKGFSSGFSPGFG
jgi:hypothetical protein